MSQKNDALLQKPLLLPCHFAITNEALEDIKLDLVPDSLPKVGGELWYSCIHSSCILEAWIWLVEYYLIALWHFTGGLVGRSAAIVIQ